MVMITIQATIAAPLVKVWEYYIQPEHVVNWNFASDDWCCPTATNDLTVGGTFVYRMEARDGSTGFDFTGTYKDVQQNKLLTFNLDDGRKVTTTFSESDGAVTVTTEFEAEDQNSAELQKQGWQSILNNFKKLVEK